MALTLPAREAARIRRHAEAAYPEEACGFLLGRDETPAAVDEARPTDNVHPERREVRYTIDPRRILATEREVREQGRSILGFYHSHPDHPARPSAFDRERAWPGYVYVILAVPHGTPGEMTAWRFDAGERVFMPVPLSEI